MIDIFSKPPLEVILKATLISLPILINLHALAMSLIAQKIAYIFVAKLVDAGAFAFGLAFLPIAFIV